MKTHKVTTILAFTLSFVFLTTLKTEAQEKGFHYGARFGIGESNLNIEGITTEKGKLALSGGAATSYQFGEIFGITADFLFTSKGATAEGTTQEETLFGTQTYKYTDKYNLFYAELPITGKLSIPIGDDFFLKAYSGPSMNFNLLALESRIYDNTDYHQDNGYFDREMKDLETIEYALIYGVGVDIISKDDRIFFLDVRSSGALTPVGNINGRSAKSNYFLISAGYMF